MGGGEEEEGIRFQNPELRISTLASEVVAYWAVATYYRGGQGQVINYPPSLTYTTTPVPPF